MTENAVKKLCPACDGGVIIVGIGEDVTTTVRKCTACGHEWVGPPLREPRGEEQEALDMLHEREHDLCDTMTDLVRQLHALGPGKGQPCDRHCGLVEEIVQASYQLCLARQALKTAILGYHTPGEQGALLIRVSGMLIEARHELEECARPMDMTTGEVN